MEQSLKTVFISLFLVITIGCNVNNDMTKQSDKERLKQLLKPMEQPQPTCSNDSRQIVVMYRQNCLMDLSSPRTISTPSLHEFVRESLLNITNKLGEPNVITTDGVSVYYLTNLVDKTEQLILIKQRGNFMTQYYEVEEYYPNRSKSWKYTMHRGP